jgi:hypothetical protein
MATVCEHMALAFCSNSRGASKITQEVPTTKCQRNMPWSSTDKN